MFRQRFQFPDDVGAAEAEFVQTISTTLWAVVQVLFEQRLLSAPALTVLVTDDIMRSADSEGRGSESGQIVVPVSNA